MKTQIDLQSPSYMPNHMLNLVAERLDIKCDKALGWKLGVSREEISRIRNRNRPIGDLIFLNASWLLDMPVRELRRWAGIEEMSCKK